MERLSFAPKHAGFYRLDIDLIRARLAIDPTRAPAQAIAAPVLSDDAVGLLDSPLVAAAVLVPIVHGTHPGVLLTKRTSHLKAHAGQVAFPGGRLEPTDRSLEEAALREAREEIGLDARHIEPVGYLDDYVTGTGFRIFPVVAIVQPPFDLSINAAEVEDVFEVPVEFLMEPANHLLHEREHGGVSRRYYAMPYGERYIWGATAGMLRNLYVRLYAE